MSSWTRESVYLVRAFFISVHQVNALFVVNFWLALLCLGSARWFSCSPGCTLSWVGWGRLVAIVAFRSGFTWGDHCLRVINTQNDFFAALHGALWRLPILGLLSESLNA